MTTTPPTTTPTPDLTTHINSILDDTIAIRHDLHAHPELKFKESRTSSVIQKHLTDLGIPFIANIGGKQANTGTGILAHLPATVDNPGPNSTNCIGLRADMDALPITEISSNAHKSTNEGVMHACGHDGHTAILLGTAKILSKLDHRPNPITLVFQPAEEGGAGAEKMIRDGIMTDLLGPPITKMFALHSWPDQPLGTIATRPGPLLASTDMFTITIQGTQAHAAYPHLSNDPIVAASHIVTAAQTIVSRSTGPTDSVVVSITTFHAGTAFNIIPAAAILQGTVRTLSAESRSATKSRLSELAQSTAKALGCTAQIDWITGYPVTQNDPGQTDKVFQIAQSSVNCQDTQLVPDATLGGEDFAFYAQLVPSCFFFLGLAKDPNTPFPGLHTPNFDFNDQSIPLGIEMMCRLALS